MTPATPTTPGKYRHLSRAATPGGHFVVLALDHRANLRDAMQQHTGRSVSDTEFLRFKQDILRELPAAVSGVLTDPAYGIGAGIASRAIRGQTGLLAPLEVTNYDLHPDQRTIEFIPDWSVRQIKQCGGDGVKLLLPYHPESATAADRRALVRRVIDDCGAYDIPLFLEPITYALDTDQPQDSAELRQITVEMAKLFAGMGVDVLKLHFPVEVAQTPDAVEWRAACDEVNAACGRVPWALLSAGVSYDVFVKQTQVACAAGASGVIVGRAVWTEAVRLQGEAREAFIRTTLRDRLMALAQLCADHAAPWFDKTPPPDGGLTWYVPSDAGA